MIEEWQHFTTTIVQTVHVGGRRRSSQLENRTTDRKRHKMRWYKNVPRETKWELCFVFLFFYSKCSNAKLKQYREHCHRKYLVVIGGSMWQHFVFMVSRSSCRSQRERETDIQTDRQKVIFYQSLRLNIKNINRYIL